MKAPLKNWSLSTKDHRLIKTAGGILLYSSCCFSLNLKAQITNYVQNGGFEECTNCVNYMGGPLIAKYWRGIDTNEYFGQLLSELPPSGLVPQSSYTYQWPKSGNNYLISSLGSQPYTTSSGRGYPLNILKQNLDAGKTYCVKFYVNISNQSSYGVDGLGAYFGDNSLDTITQPNKPISYLIPQIQNPSGNIIKDTLNWVLITGTFTATGSEKYLMLGNFKSDAAMDTLMINPANLPAKFIDALYDDVSCIDIDLPAFACANTYTYVVPGDSVFLGRQPDVGINEACIWYKLPNMTTPIDTVAGFWAKPVITTTYVVRQEICAGIRWDTVVVSISALGIKNLEVKIQNLQLYPVPAQDELYLKWSQDGLEKEFTRAEILNSLGQTAFESDLTYNGKSTSISVKDLIPGVYTLRLKSVNSMNVTKRFVIEH